MLNAKDSNLQQSEFVSKHSVKQNAKRNNSRRLQSHRRKLCISVATRWLCLVEARKNSGPVVEMCIIKKVMLARMRCIVAMLAAQKSTQIVLLTH